MNENEVVGTLSALAQPVRLQVLRALVAAGDRGLTPSTMAEGLGVPQNTLSFHLKELARSGLVSQQRASRHIVYRATGERMDALLGWLGAECRAAARKRRS